RGCPRSPGPGARANRRGNSLLAGLTLGSGLLAGVGLGLGRLVGLLRLGLAGLGVLGLLLVLALVAVLGLLALGLVLLAGLLLALGGVRLRAAARLLKGLGEDLLLGRLGRGDLQLALGTRQALELLPVAGDLQDALHRLGRLRADLQPVLGPLGVNLDEARLLLRVVLADRLDGLAIPTGTRVGYHDPVVGGTDLAKALQSDLDGHGCGTPRSFALRFRRPRAIRVGADAAVAGFWGSGRGERVRPKQ